MADDAARRATGVLPADSVWDRAQVAHTESEQSLAAQPEAAVPQPVRDGIAALGDLLGIWHGYGED